MNMSTAAMAANMPQADKVRTRVDCVFLCITDSFVDIEYSSINIVWPYGLLDAQEFYEKKPRIIRPRALCTLKKYASSHIQTILSVSEFALRASPIHSPEGGRGLYRRWGLAPRPEEFLFWFW